MVATALVITIHPSEVSTHEAFYFYTLNRKYYLSNTLSQDLSLTLSIKGINSPWLGLHEPGRRAQVPEGEMQSS